MKMLYSPAALARLFKFVREAGPNAGQRVEAIQKWCGGAVGESWCCYFVTMILDICFEGNAPIPRGGSCQAVYDLAKKNGWIVLTPEINDLFLYVNDADHAHHIGIVTVPQYDGLPAMHNTLWGIAGNTSEDGTSSNGTGVFEHEIHTKVFVAYPRG